MWLAPAVAAMALALTPATAAPDPGHQKGHGGPPGQAAVLYDGDRVLASATLA